MMCQIIGAILKKRVLLMLSEIVLTGMRDARKIKKSIQISRPAGSDETGEKILLAIIEKIGKEHFGWNFRNDATCRSDDYIVVFSVDHSFSADRIRREFSHDIDEAILAVLGIKKPYDFLVVDYY